MKDQETTKAIPKAQIGDLVRINLGADYPVLYNNKLGLVVAEVSFDKRSAAEWDIWVLVEEKNIRFGHDEVLIISKACSKL